ncbi:hypothetical protein WMY93_000623 [Mugilogobius chulae]|uniref:Uncharacterized protein n=1 Tax=Mugilogobius chulae TaxID=88201 RepID=A0AAW0Q2Y2_9GOBI
MSLSPPDRRSRKVFWDGGGPGGDQVEDQEETQHREQLTSGVLEQYFTGTFRDLSKVQSDVAESRFWLQKWRRRRSSSWQESELQTRLTEVLENIRRRLQELTNFMEALERLAVTSEHVLKPSSQLQVSVDLRSVGKVLFVENKELTPNKELLNSPKQNIEELELFFSPKLQNIEPLQLQLQVYITALRSMCRPLQDSDLMDFCLDMPQVHLRKELSEEQRTRIKELQQLRMNESVRLLFLLKHEAQTLVFEFNQGKTQMQQCLKKLEECAVKLDACRQVD